uniref:DNA excision repair protein ERCC-6-like n=1 Tax=Callorhinchus milii TaxID=7868 RepID=A0A4W3GZ54_CALMI
MAEAQGGWGVRGGSGRQGRRGVGVWEGVGGREGREGARRVGGREGGRGGRLREALAEMEAEQQQQQQREEEEEEEFVDVLGSGLRLYRQLYERLYRHQREGVAFLYGLHRRGRRGGILADDMGLGKTVQVIAFLSGMFDADLVRHCLLVLPSSLIHTWSREFTHWTPGMRVKALDGLFHGSKNERTKNLEKVQRRGGVVITTYQMLINNWGQLSSFQGREFTWDYTILDEAHKIKTSSTKTAKSAHAIPARNRILLTGTPVQNNLQEMWALFDFACQGSLLGSSKTFKMEYGNPITRAREKDSTPGEKALGLKISENLMEIIKPYFLRRTKEDMPTLSRKNDFIIWEGEEEGGGEEGAVGEIDGVSDQDLIQESGKMVFLVGLLERLKAEGNRTLVFSQSRKMLDIIQRVLVNRGFLVMRIDGTVQLPERQKKIGIFQREPDYSVFLLTTQVGGVGLTLTAANRVVIFDPSWNPATDAQAVDRAYRIGQTENVVIYRLITCGSVEEKIYRRLAGVSPTKYSQPLHGVSVKCFEMSQRHDRAQLEVCPILGTTLLGRMSRPWRRCRFTRMVPGKRDFSYVERRERLQLFSLEQRRLRGDLIEVFQIMRGFDRVEREKLFPLACGRVTRAY